MKLCQTLTLATLAANFNSVFAISNTDLVNENGIIWNSDQSLCLKMYGPIFPNQKQDFSHLSGNPRAKAKAERKQNESSICEKVSVGFSSDCRKFLDEGTYTAEEDFPVEYKFRISDHGDYFCIIGANGVNHPCNIRETDNATWKVTKFSTKHLKQNKNWKRRDFGGVSNKDLEQRFGLEPYGCPTCTSLTHYFKFEDQTNALIYGTFASGDDNPQYVSWNDKSNNLLTAKAGVEQKDLLANKPEESSCGDSSDEPVASAQKYLYNDYDSFMDSVTNKDQIGVNVQSYTNPHEVVFEGNWLIFTNPNEKKFVAAIKLPTGNCSRIYGHVNFRFLAKDYSYPPEQQITLNSLTNCEDFNHLDQSDISMQQHFNPLFGHEDIIDELVNGDGDYLISDPETGKNQVDVNVYAQTVFSIENQFMDWFVLDDTGVPTYLTTLKLYFRM